MFHGHGRGQDEVFQLRQKMFVTSLTRLGGAFKYFSLFFYVHPYYCGYDPIFRTYFSKGFENTNLIPLYIFCNFAAKY